MNLIILDKNFDTLGIVSVFNTLLWDRRYYAPGLFELHAPAEFFELMNSGLYLYRNDREELGVIREVNFTRDAKGATTAYCKGYFAEELLNNRVLNQPVSLTGTPESIGRQLVQRFIINPSDAGRKIPQIILGPVNGVGSSVTVTATGDKLGDKLYEIEKTQELSHRLRYDYLTNTLSFEVWKGKDRTDAQTENSWAIFSDSFYNIKNAIYDRDESEYKNFAYVAGEGEGNARIIVEVDLRSSPDEERRELYVDARDLQSTYTDDGGEEHTYGLAQWTYWSRKEALLNFARKTGASIGSLEMQLDFMIQELKGYVAVWEVLRTARTVKEASDIVLTKYERPANMGSSVKAKRASYGQAYFDAYAKTDTDTEKEATTMSAKITTAAQLAQRAFDVAKNFKTLYVMGCFGAPMNATNKTRYCNNHDYNRDPTRQAMIKAASADTFGFDCVCLIKGLLWGWTGDASKVYGGAG